MNDLSGATDIEIYVRKNNADKIADWLINMGWSVDDSTSHKGTLKLSTRFNNLPIAVLIVNSGKYCSVWFQSADTPWDDDLSCARDAFSFLHQEVRASQGGWQENSDDERWWKIDATGEALIDWQGA